MSLARNIIIHNLLQYHYDHNNNSIYIKLTSSIIFHCSMSFNNNFKLCYNYLLVHSAKSIRMIVQYTSDHELYGLITFSHCILVILG